MHIDDEANDAELITRYRAGDDRAASVLFTRHHDPAVRFAARLAGRSSADDLAAEAFSQVLSALRNGRGPDVAFRAYLITSIRNTHINSSKRDGRLTWVEDHEKTGGLTTAADETALRSESSLLAQAFATLPERWQTVLWHTSVEDDSTAEVGRLLGITPSAVAALAYRAREGLRQAYLSAHVAATDDPSCQEVRESLPAYSRGRLGALDRRRIEEHLDDCSACAAVLADLRGMTSNLPALLIPALLGSAGAAIHGRRPRKKSKQQEAPGRAVGKDGGRVGSGGRVGLARAALSRTSAARSIAVATAVAATCVVAIVLTRESNAPDGEPLSASGLGGGEVLTLIEPPAPVPTPTDKVEPAPDEPFIQPPVRAPKPKPKPKPAPEPEPPGTTYDLVLTMANVSDLGDDMSFDLDVSSPEAVSTLLVNITTPGEWNFAAAPPAGADCTAPSGTTPVQITCIFTPSFAGTISFLLLDTGGTKAFTGSLTAADNTDPTPGDAAVSFNSP